MDKINWHTVKTTQGYVLLDKNTIKYAYVSIYEGFHGYIHKLEFIDKIDSCTIFSNKNQFPKEIWDELERLDLEKVDVTITTSIEINN